MAEGIDRERLARLLGGDALAGLRRRLRARYADGPPAADGFTLTRLAAIERDTLAGLLGKPRVAAASMRLSHTAFDAALADAGLAPDLRAALEALDGPIADTAAARERAQRRWAVVFAHAPTGPLADALAGRRAQGLLKRLAGNDFARATRIIDDAARVFARLPASGVTRSHLAAATLGDAHGLDQGRGVATLLRRALDPERRLARMRDVWAAHGVLVGELAKPVVVLNLAASGTGVVDRLLGATRAAGEPVHLSLRQLLRHAPTWEHGQRVHVCENPDVLAAAADRLGPGCPAMVSVDGQLSAAPRSLLDQLAAVGSRLYYHGDFDWPGLAIGNHIVSRYNATPWRFCARDYVPQQGVALAGEPVAAIWDAELATHMSAAGLAVHEEAQLDTLLGDLAAFARDPEYASYETATGPSDRA